MTEFKDNLLMRLFHQKISGQGPMFNDFWNSNLCNLIPLSGFQRSTQHFILYLKSYTS